MNESFVEFVNFADIYGARLVAAAIAGAIIGFEGEIYEKPAGLRTNILITLGAAIFSTISYVVGVESLTGETTRIAAQIITGIGFIGAGVIIHYRFHVQGITTASTIFVNSAIGMTIGFGYIFSGVGIAIIVFLILVLLRPVDDLIERSSLITRLRKRDEERSKRKRLLAQERELLHDSDNTN